MVTGELVLFRPSRLVTEDGTGWWMTQCRDGSLGYTNQDLYGRGEPVSISELIGMQVFGRVRPVESPRPHEAEVIRVALYEAGELAVNTLAHALGQCAKLATLDVLVAGRPGSWESYSLKSFTQWGLRRPRGRVHEYAATMIVGQVMAWVADPHRYVEVAETLAGLFAQIADRRAREWLATFPKVAEVEPSDVYAKAWTSMADRELWPDAYEGATVGEEWYHYLMSTASMFSVEWYTQWGSGHYARWREGR